MKKTLIFFTTLVILLIFGACVEDQLGFNKIRKAPWQAKWAVPLVSTSMNLDDILKDNTGLIQEDENGLLSLIYESDDIASINAAELVTIPEQNKTLEENFDLPDLPPNQTIPLSIDFPFEFTTEQEGQRLDSIYFSEGIYQLNLSTDLNKDQADVEVLVPSLVDKNTYLPLSFNIDLSNGGGGTLNWETSIDLSNYILKFDAANPNQLNIACDITIVTDENPNNSPYFFSVTSNFSEMVFSYVFGYLGNYEVELGDTIALSIFKLNLEGHFEFGPTSVSFKLTSENSYGLPIDVELTKIRAYHGGDQPSDSVDVYLFDENEPNLISIQYPDYTQIGESVITEVLCENSNIEDALNISPDKIIVDVIGTLNPEDDPDIANFILDESQFITDINLELELFGAASGFRVADTLDFATDLKGLKSLEMLFDIENGFPIQAAVWLHLLDSTGVKIFEILSPEELIIAGGETGGEANGYKVITPAKKLTSVMLETDGIDAIKKTRRIVVNAELATTNGEFVKIYSDYNILIKLGANMGFDY